MENLFKDTGSNSFRNGPDDKGRFGDYGGSVRFGDTYASDY